MLSRWEGGAVGLAGSSRGEVARSSGGGAGWRWRRVPTVRLVAALRWLGKDGVLASSEWRLPLCTMASDGTILVVLAWDSTWRGGFDRRKVVPWVGNSHHRRSWTWPKVLVGCESLYRSGDGGVAAVTLSGGWSSVLRFVAMSARVAVAAV